MDEETRNRLLEAAVRNQKERYNRENPDTVEAVGLVTLGDEKCFVKLCGTKQQAAHELEASKDLQDIVAAPIGIFKVEQKWYFVMEHLPFQLTPEFVRVHPECFPTFINQLRLLHDKGYIHGDIKPEHFFLDSEHRARFIDVGFSRKPEPAPSTEHQTEHQTPKPSQKLVVKTPNWLLARGFQGTSTYASGSTLIGMAPTKTDDLQSLFFSAMYFLGIATPLKAALRTLKVDGLADLDLGNHTSRGKVFAGDVMAYWTMGIDVNVWFKITQITKQTPPVSIFGFSDWNEVAIGSLTHRQLHQICLELTLSSHTALEAETCKNACSQLTQVFSTATRGSSAKILPTCKPSLDSSVGTGGSPQPNHQTTKPASPGWPKSPPTKTTRRLEASDDNKDRGRKKLPAKSDPTRKTAAMIVENLAKLLLKVPGCQATSSTRREAQATSVVVSEGDMFGVRLGLCGTIKDTLKASINEAKEALRAESPTLLDLAAPDGIDEAAENMIRASDVACASFKESDSMPAKHTFQVFKQHSRTDGQDSSSTTQLKGMLAQQASKAICEAKKKIHQDQGTDLNVTMHELPLGAFTSLNQGPDYRIKACLPNDDKDQPAFIVGEATITTGSWNIADKFTQLNAKLAVGFSKFAATDHLAHPFAQIFAPGVALYVTSCLEEALPHLATKYQVASWSRDLYSKPYLRVAALLQRAQLVRISNSVLDTFWKAEYNDQRHDQRHDQSAADMQSNSEGVSKQLEALGADVRANAAQQQADARATKLYIVTNIFVMFVFILILLFKN